jgi:hypothetical protein
VKKGIIQLSRYNWEQGKVAERENHLDIDQIEWFLEARVRNRKDLTRPELFESVSNHLTTCENCQRLVSMYENWDRVLLNVDEEATDEATVDCPPYSALVELAAGTASESEAEKLLTHVIDCHHCGPQLRYAREVFVEELSTDEQQQLNGLQSSNPEWQAKLAKKMTVLASSMPEWQRPFAPGLHEARSPGPAPSPGYSWRSLLHLLLKPASLALVVTSILFLVLGIQASNWKKRSDAQTARASADIERLRQENALQRSRISQLTAQLGSADVPAATADRYRRGLAASLVLEPGITRSAGEMNRLKLTTGVQFVSIMLRLAQMPSGVLRKELLSPDRQPIWSEMARASADEVKSGNLLLMVPAHVLAAGDYQIVLSRQSNDGFEEIATYAFRVSR